MHRGKVIAATVAAAIVLLLLVWGSGAGTSVLHSPSGEARTGQGDEQRTIQVNDQAEVTQVPSDGLESAAPALDWLMIAFALVVLAIVVKILKWLLNRDWEESGPPDEDEEIDDLGLLLGATSESTRAAALAEGEPRNVVVRCWVALEDAAASSGLERNPAETAAEFTRRFLGTWDVDEATTRELAELYREARFSRHPVARPVAERAAELVGSIHDQLRRARRAAPEEPVAEEPVVDQVAEP
ncbi:DUF4129 domain-containing protein [Ornithinimicrobium cryptoxanthini]|uniref:DUF4129 domain-containing protein n=1 Tax=Ornithinimicrobium cryptoxanthini TaxID=2934161 RepID=UPI0021176ECD|nr:DUF4129 domain-containing protein [Ornithinimicrobium cryptoxanthini]